MTNTKVRIIKRNQQSVESRDTESAAEGRTSNPERELKATVANWVSEFRQQQRQSFDKRAFDNLFNAA